ncbi:hypothetical protein CISIN_1g043778mg, partial [Citrus sinensis]
NLCSPSFSCDSNITRCPDCTVRKASSIRDLQKNLEALPRELQKLVETRNDVRIRVIVAEQQKMKRLEQVEPWFSRVQDAESEVAKLMLERNWELKKLCLGGCCSKSCKSSYKVEGDFQEVAQRLPENPVDARPVALTIVGLESIFDKLWRCLTEEQVGIIGLYGMGSVGKTTLLILINNKFLDEPNYFDVVIWAVASKVVEIEKIQESIAKKIGFFNESWESKTVQEKAVDIFNILSKKKYEDAWKLFEEKVGRDILDSHPNIPELVETVAKECGAMASRKTHQEWEYAIEVWRNEYTLVYSYDFLPSDVGRFCLLIDIDQLVDFWICEGFLDEYDGIAARNQGYCIVGTLLHACLLEEEEGNRVKMHDVIRDMALWIASTFENKNEKFLVLAGVGLTAAPSVGV